MRSFPRSLKLPRHPAHQRLRFVAVNMVLALVAVLAPTALMPAGAAEPVQVNFTLEGCRNNGGIIFPVGSDFICEDPAYTTGNLGKGWNELDLVPHRVTLRNDGTTQIYTFVVAGDYANSAGTAIGWDDISVLTLNTELSKGVCPTNPTESAVTITPSGDGVGGADQTIYREVTLTQLAGTTCVYDYTQRLALGAHDFSGSSLQSNLWNESLASSGIGQKRLSLPVNEIEPQELSKDMSATQGTGFVWAVTKSASPANLNFQDTCTTIPAGTGDVEITVTWTKTATTAETITVITHVYATNPAAREITVNVRDAIRSGTTVLETYPPLTDPAVSVDVPANATDYLVLTHTTTVPSGTTDLNDVATATYTDKVTGIPVPGATQAVASATVRNVASEANATAIITDVESITGAGFSYSVESFDPPTSGSLAGYEAGTPTTGNVTWTSVPQTASGSVTFQKTVYATAGLAGDGLLSDTATVANSPGVPVASAEVDLFADADVNLTINKTIPAGVLTGEETASFDFEVYNLLDELVGTTTLTLSADDNAESAVISGLDPGSYRVHEVPDSSGEWGSQADKSVTIALPACQGSVSFANPRNTGDLTIVKVATGGTGTFLFDVDCSRDAYDRMGDNPVEIVGSDEVILSGIPTGTTCTVIERDNPLFSSVVLPPGGAVTIIAGPNLVSFTNTAKPIGITLDKKVNGGDHATSGDALLAHSGDPLNYSVVITNNGQLPLIITTLADTLVAGFAATCTQGIDSILAPGDSFTCTYQVIADGDAHNVASVTGVDGLDRDVSDSDETFVDVINPDIEVVKTVDDTNPDVGQTVTYTYVVTNTGDTSLSGVTVDDDVLGGVGTIDFKFEPGATATLTKTMVVAADSESINIATAEGTDILGQTVTDTDDAAITVVLGIVLQLPAELPRTGFPVTGFVFIGLAMLASGLALQSVRRRRRLA